jgi:hypothetical protein
VRLEGLGKSEKIKLIGARSRDLPVYSIVPEPLRYRVPPVNRFNAILLSTFFMKFTKAACGKLM